MNVRTPVDAVFCDRVEDGKQLAHCGNQRDILSLARLDEPLVIVAQHGIVTHGSQRSHVQGTAYVSAAAPDGSLSAHEPGVTVQWRHAYQGSDASSVKLAQFRQFCEQHRDTGCADAGYAAQRLSQLSVMAFDMRADLGVAVTEFVPEKGRYPEFRV
ncbi:hypothetical protein WT67_20010 [Burkholderia stagnalis]|nr:hypothetical protein WT17_06840 [Burkholderia stagnalis]KVO79893.1 hypothetical protein WT19_04385 [Burkholderia stagnalis]KVW56005.1 hypothetical protein WT28_28110 [Burkholderia stagnalis]KVW71808.1 hypothetical protein WT29_32030 [Burkholderia stagnalis]KVX76718.1 hypothetical protein WT34_12885 [Burkholderia stagnalis]